MQSYAVWYLCLQNQHAVFTCRWKAIFLEIWGAESSVNNLSEAKQKTPGMWAQRLTITIWDIILNTCPKLNKTWLAPAVTPSLPHHVLSRGYGHTHLRVVRDTCQIDHTPKPVWSKSSQVILAPDIIHFSVSGPFKPFSTNTGRKSPMCAEQSLECETSHSLRMQKRLPFQNKGNIWVFPGCTTALVHKCPHCRLVVLWFKGLEQGSMSADFMVQ